MVQITFEMSGPSALWTSPHFKQRNTPIVADLKCTKYRFYNLCTKRWEIKESTAHGYSSKAMCGYHYINLHMKKSMIQFINTKKEEHICKEALQVSLLWNGKRNTCLNRNDDFTYAHLGSGALQSAHILLSLFSMRSFNFFALPITREKRI